MNTQIDSADLNSIDYQLRHLITTWDMRMAKYKHYNTYALGLYMQQVDNIVLDIKLGADTRAAIVAGLNGPMLDHVLRGMKLLKSTDKEQMGSGIYEPVSKDHPVHNLI